MKQPSSLRLLVSVRFLSAAGATLLFIVSAGSVSARPGFQVNRTGDDADASINGICETATGNGVCTLRAAIQEAIANSSQDIGISFSIPTSDPGYNAQTGAWTIYVSILPDLNKSSRLGPASLNINGPGATKLIIAAANGRVFNVTTTGTVSFSGLTITNGLTSGTDYGAGIQNVNGGTVNITNCIVSGNRAITGNGGFSSGGAGISNASTGIINITNSTLSLNRAQYVGGAIWNQTGTVNISNTTFDHNQSAAGGGIYNNGGTVSVVGSTFYGNTADNSGAIASGGGMMRITNCTFYANAVDIGSGGAIANYGSSTLYLTNSTVAANFSNFGSAVSTDTFNGAIAYVKSSIIALNYGGGALGSGAGPDVSGAFTSQGFNFIGQKDGSTGFTVATDKKGTIAAPLNPKLDFKGLRNNGGPTDTVALVKGSPAIDKGTGAGLTGTLTSDQRGLARTVDSAAGNANGGDGTDIGAFEVQP